jgi:hypothetical protein
MEWTPGSVFRWLFASEQGASTRLISRWLFLRALGLIYFSAFYALLFQIRGLIGPQGILPASDYLQAIGRSSLAQLRFWYVPSLLWVSTASTMLMAIVWIGLIASILLVLNLWPRTQLAICFICLLSFVAAAQDFSAYQSDGMLLEAGFISLFFVPPGLRPGLGSLHPPSRASLFLLQWEWFRIYFESGLVKLASGDLQWRNFTAMDEYYQNGPLPTWIGWYLQHLPHWFHAGTVLATLVMELSLIWMFLFPRRFRIALFYIVTFWQLGVIATANYAFLNYLVLAMGVLIVDDRFLLKVILARWRSRIEPQLAPSAPPNEKPSLEPLGILHAQLRRRVAALKIASAAVILTWIFYATTVEMILIFAPRFPFPMVPVIVLEPFRIANQYGLFAVMTRVRYEIEFQGTSDGQTWTPYRFQYKPQALNEAPGIYAPYQPRFDWNLWFASLASWRNNLFVPKTEVRLLENDRDVLRLFAENPFAQAPPKQVRAVLWQYWFTTMAEKRATGNWWRRQLIGIYAPTLERLPDGKVAVVEMPREATPQP